MQRGSHASKHEGEKLRYKDQGPSSRQKGRVLELEGGQQLVLIWEREGEGEREMEREREREMEKERDQRDEVYEA